ncbi:MAG: hypothetical protein IJX02_09065 [Clostridia bacterium]|nr:hypothetical protein [Clostridia bacterium]
MKKILIFVFALALCLCLSTVCFAEDEMSAELSEKENAPSVTQGVTPPSADRGLAVNVKEYITEKIVPVAVGVLTSIIALGATLFKVAGILKSLRDAKDTFEGEARVRAELSRELKQEAQGLQETVKDVPGLNERVNALTERVEALAEILVLGFSANSEVIKSGKGKKMAALLEKSKSFSSSNEINPPSEFVK